MRFRNPSCIKRCTRIRFTLVGSGSELVAQIGSRSCGRTWVPQEDDGTVPVANPLDLDLAAGAQGFARLMKDDDGGCRWEIESLTCVE